MAFQATDKSKRHPMTQQSPFEAAQASASLTAIEADLTRIWIEVLNLERVGLHENFFDLGGHSLAATQILSRICLMFGVALSPDSFFAAPTIAGLASRIAEAVHIQPGAPVSAIPPGPREGPLPLSPAQERLWFLEHLEPNTPLYNIALVLSLEGSLNIAGLTQALNSLGQRHAALRATFPQVDGQPVQVITPHLNLAVPLTDLKNVPHTEREAQAHQLSRAEAQRPFDLTRGPLIRVALLRLAEERHWLVLTLHHIISDAWSVDLLKHDLPILYQAGVTGQASPLPDLSIQYADLITWQRAEAQSERLAAQLTYWQKRLGQAPPRLQLPTDHPRPPQPSHRGASLRLTLSQSLTAALRELSQQANTTLFMTLLAAFKTLLYRYTGQTDLSLGLPITQRRRPELEGLISFLVNTLALRTDASGDPSFRVMLARVKAVALEAYTNQDLPFEKVIEALQPKGSRDPSPFFQAALVSHTSPTLPNTELPGLKITAWRVDTETAKMDLALFVEELAHGVALRWEYAAD